MTTELFSAKWVSAWLEGREHKNICACSDPRRLIVGLVDLSTAEHIHFKIKECRVDSRLYKFYHQGLKNNSNVEGQMLRDWFDAISTY